MFSFSSNKSQKIGIWGLGLVGKSFLSYCSKNQKIFTNNKLEIEIFDARDLTEEEKKLILTANAKIFKKNDLVKFLSAQDVILPSPGVNFQHYCNFRAKFKSELSIFAQAWNKPSIAVTGTLGKTSLVWYLNSILNQLNIRSTTGGNIGNPLLDLLPKQDNLDTTVLELSSFQLELDHNFSPQIAIWTNFYPNHLDRHKNLTQYFKAKASIFKNQTEKNFSIMPLEFSSTIRKYLIKKDRPLIFFSSKDIKNQRKADVNKFLENLQNNDIVYFLSSYNSKNIVEKYVTKEDKYYTVNTHLELQALAQLHIDNRLIIDIVLDLLNLKNDLSNMSIESIPHRCELVKSYNNLEFYNDSKSTVIEATIGAVKKLYDGQSILILFLGGTSKGVSRQKRVKELSKYNIDKIFCFGAEVEMLFHACSVNNLKAHAHKNLDDSFFALKEYLKELPKDKKVKILFSPGGASFDLFINYKQRGEKFKELIYNNLI